jgi:hypothetical protein
MMLLSESKTRRKCVLDENDELVKSINNEAFEVKFDYSTHDGVVEGK